MFWTAFILGLAGSLHCAGMCSPLAFAVTNMSSSALVNRLIYNAGRIFTYGILGVIVSSIGVALPLERFQNGLSTGMGILLIAIGLIGASKFQIRALSRPIQRFTSFIKNQFSQQIQSKSSISYLILGGLNGLLPCGLTFIALTTALITPTALDGFLFMLLFGIGTLPVMIGLVSVVQIFTNRFKLNISKVNMIMLVLAGCLLIGRATMSKTHLNDTANSTEVICP